MINFTVMCRSSSLYQFTYPLLYTTPVTFGEFVGKPRKRVQKHPITRRNANDRLQRCCYDTGKSPIIQCRFFLKWARKFHIKLIDVEFANTVTWESCTGIELSGLQITLFVKKNHNTFGPSAWSLSRGITFMNL